MSRLTIDLTDEQHKRLKAIAALEGKTIRQFATERLFPAKDDLDADWESFKLFMDARIDQAIEGNISDRTFDQIVETAFARKSAA